MAGRVYQTTRGKINWLPDLQSQGWSEFFHVPNNPDYPNFTAASGFEAVSFQNGNEIVISFAGTGTAVDWWANAGGAFGVTSAQLQQAADYYLQIKAANPVAAISFTGHSLGGGLASLLAVMFNETAVTFDQAPFRNSATAAVANDLMTYLSGKGYGIQDLQGLSNFISAAANGSIPNESNVTDFNVQGEALGYLPFSRIGTQSDIANSSNGASTVDLHSQTLLTAFLQSNQTAAANQTLSDVTAKLPDLLKMIFDSKLYYNDPNNTDATAKENFLERLVRHQNGVAGLVAGETPITADMMLTRFTTDLWKIAQDGGLTLNESNGQPIYVAALNNVSKALTAFAMQKYYEEQAAAPGASPAELFAKVTGGIQFDIASVSTKISAAFQAGEKANLTDAKGYQYFEAYINGKDNAGQTSPYPAFNSAERALIKSILPQLRDWYVQAGVSGMVATDTLNRGAFMLGGTGSDALVGGTAADLLVGNAGDDVLSGGQANDTLLGGVGVDTYAWQAGQNAGIDTILDSDNTGYLRDDTTSSIVLTGGEQFGDNHVFRGTDANGQNHLYTFVTGDKTTGGDLIVDGAMLIKNYNPNTGNHMGITFADAVAQANPATTHDIKGDPLIHNATVSAIPGDWAVTSSVSNGDGTVTVDYYLKDADGNPTQGGQQDRTDSLNGTTANDHIMSGAGNDTINAAQGGNDLIEAGSGRDIVYAGAGNDVIIGGTEGDILYGGMGDDRLYADTQINTTTAIANGNTHADLNAQGDWLAGGAGDDTLVGSDANDVLSGGAGADLLIAGAGNDDIMGDTDWVATNFNWTVADQADGTRYFYPTNSNAKPVSGAADVIYAGDGNDHVWGQFGNDVIFGEGGADKLQGGSGNDTILGGAGEDWLYGEGQPGDTAGSDYLDGGADNDVIFGGAGDDILIGGAGIDTLYGGTGQDTYIFNRGDGNDTVYDLKAENNVFRFGAGISQKDITLRLGSLMLDLGNGDAVHLRNVEQRAPTQLELDAGIYQPGDVVDVLTDFDRNDVFNSSSIGSFEFEDGTVLNANELLARGFDLDGTAGDDIIAGTNTIDRINGLSGNDLLQGGAGDDVYLFDAGGGQDTINDTQGTNTLHFGAGILPGDITFARSGMDMVLGVSGTTDRVTLQNWGANSASRISRVEFADGTVWDSAHLQAQIPSVINGTAGDDVQTAWFDQNTLMYGLGGNDTLMGNNGNDTLQGGAGNDTMDGGDGADTFEFKLGAGQDVIVNSDYMDSLVFGAGIAASSVRASTSASGLHLNYGDRGDSVLLAGAYPDELRFADGAVLKIEQLFTTQGVTLGYDVVGSAVGETLADTHFWANSFTGGAGDDILLGGGGDTTYHFNRGDGKDKLIDLAGQDTLAFGAGITVNDIAFSYGNWGDYSPRFKVHYGATDTISILKGERGAIEKFVFADGTSYSFAQMAALKHFTAPAETIPAGTTQIGGGNLIVGTSGSDAIYSDNGVEPLAIYSAGKGNDRIQINENDGTGVASLLFNVGDGHDTINVVKNSAFNSLPHNTSLVFGGGINPNSLTFSSTSYTALVYHGPFSGGWYMDTVTEQTIRYGTQGDSIVVEGGLDNSATFEFANGMHYSYNQMRLVSLGLGGGIITGGGEAVGTYQYNPGSGSQVIYGNSVTVGGQPVSSMSFGSGIAPSMLSLGLGSLLVRVGDSGDELHIADFNPDDAYAPNQVQSFSFSDGTTLSYSQLIGLGFDLKGSAGDDVITGTSATDRIDGYAGNDTLSGGAGNDILNGGAGDDTYVFGYGDGVDHVYDYDLSANVDTVSFKASVSQGNVEAVRNGDDLELHLAGAADILVLSNWYADNAYRIEQVQFADGTVWDKYALAEMTGVLILPDQTVLEDNAFSFAIPADAFNGSNLAYTATLADGGPLPDWLTSDSATGTLSGTPGNLDVGNLSLTITATGAGGQSASSSLLLNVLNVNDAPTVVNPVTDQSVIAGQAFSFKLSEISLAGNSFLNDTTDTGTPVSGGANYSYTWGGVGNDIYSFARGVGNVYLYDWDPTPGNVDVVRFAADILPTDIAVMTDQWGSVTLSVNGTSDSLTLGNWLSSDGYKIEQLVFADGTVWGVNDLMPMVSAVPTTGNDYITGTDGNDTIKALAGDDGLSGGAGNDTLLGGAGNDVLDGEGGSDILVGGSGADEIDVDYWGSDTANDLLSGGAGDDNLYSSIANDLLIGGIGDDYVEGNDGNDVALFNRGDGNDWYGSDSSYNEVPLAQRTDAVSLGGGINYADLSFERMWGDLILHVGPSASSGQAQGGESISFYEWFNTDWQDNKAISTLQMIAEAMPGYDSNSSDPLLNKRVQQFDFVGLANRFEAAQAADPTIVTWQLAPHLADFSLGGSDTAAIGGDMAYLYGKNGNLDGLSEAELRAQLNDAGFGTANQTLTKTAPGAGAAVFYDVDFIHGDSLAYSATLADGSALPGWLAFDAATETFSGTPGNGDAGVLSVAVTATDSGGLSATTNFVLTVTGDGPINVAPLAADDTVDVGEDAVRTTIAAAGLLANDTDPDAGDTLALSGFDTATVQGSTVSRDANGNLVLDIGDRYQSLGAGQTASDTFSYTVADAAGLTSTAAVNVTVTGVNDAPVVATPIAGQQTNEDAPFSFTVPAGSLADIDNGDALVYSATLADGSALPGWLTFDAATQTFGGTPGNGDVGSLSVLVTATDTGGLSASGAFSLDVANVNDAPAANADTGAAAEDGGAVLLDAAVLLANDADPDFIHGDVLNVAGVSQAASGAMVSLVNGGIQYDAGTLFQSLAQGQTATDTFSYTVSDTAGATGTAQVTMSVTGVNDGPVVAAPIASQQTNEDAPFSFTVTMGTFTDIDNADVLTYTATLADGSALPGWLTFDAATQAFSGTPGNWDVGNYSVTVTATDTGGLSASSTFAVDVANVNDAPTVSMALAGQATLQDASFSFTVPVGTFNDVDFIHGDTLTYSATLADGTALPGWLSFDVATQTFSGTPGNGDVGILNVLVTATDTGGLSASSAFNLNVVNVNDTPAANADSGTVIEDGGAVLLDAATLLANDTDPDFIHGDALNIVGVSQAASGAAVSLINGAVQYDIGSLYQSLAQGQTATDTFSYTVSDLAGATSIATVTMTVTGVNDGPITVNDTAAVQEDAALVATGNVLANDTDVDQGTVLSVANAGTLQGNYGSLVLNADGSYTYMLDNASLAVQSLAAGQIVTETFAYQATDGIAFTPATLTVSITGTNDAPVVVADVAVAQEDLTIIATGNVLANDTDVDQGAMLGVVDAGLFAGSYGQLTLAADGSYSYALNNASLGVQSLAAGQVVTETFAYAATDGLIATPSMLTVTITGTNDAPVTVADAAAVQEDLSISATGNVLINDSDVDQGAVLGVLNAGVFAGNYGQLTLAADGNYSYALDNASPGVQSLAAGQVVTETFAYEATDGTVATPSALTVSITGTNDTPAAVADAAYVREDLNITATGNVLANDSDVDQGTVLSVADAGIRAGSYGSLNLAADGSYSYAVDNASPTVQSLGRAAQVAEHFGYTATDGMVGASSVLDVFLNGANDAPILVAPLADQDFTFDKHFSWQMPEGSFTDIDQGDTLDYAATLADGSALPDWLNFDAATRTFSGETPKEVGFVDVQVTATDSVAATGSTAGSLSASDVFRISVSHGNEGVGNGKDAPPPGHDRNTNDGGGTAPGRPGSKGGNGHPSASAKHPQEQEPHDRSSDAKKHKDDTPQQDTGDSGSQRTDELIRTWFEEESTSERYSSFSTLDRHGAWGGQVDRQVKRNVDRGISGDVSSEWERMNAQLKKHLEQSGGDDAHFSESGTGSRSFGLFGSGGQQGIPQLGTGNGQQLKALAGLKEGLERLGC
jgi:VCBS repeat-containing protein